ncbi:hypothetical protein AOX55_0000867 [Sinorhizobium fredii CCBAU 25509]|nr:hypothetical protein AOX55_0000867 [Sinorhizobium fredii CCBAU 25509]
MLVSSSWSPVVRTRFRGFLLKAPGMMAFWLFDGSNIFLMCLSFQHNSPRYT